MVLSIKLHIRSLTAVNHAGCACGTRIPLVFEFQTISSSYDYFLSSRVVKSSVYTPYMNIRQSHRRVKRTIMEWWAEIRIAAHGGLPYVCTGEYTEDFTDSAGYGCRGDFALINHGHSRFEIVVERRIQQLYRFKDEEIEMCTTRALSGKCCWSFYSDKTPHAQALEVI